MRPFIFTGLLLAAAVMLQACASLPGGGKAPLAGANVLVFSKTVGFRHDSIETGQQAMRDLARQHGFAVTVTEDAALFTDDGLKTYDAVVFLNTTGDVLDDSQQAAFERYIRSGHGLVGVHAATDTESDGKWPWYTKLIGGHFLSHPEIQEARLVIDDRGHPAIAADPALAQAGEFRFTDEWYDHRDTNPDVHAIISIDRASYTGSKLQGVHPEVWSNDFDGGRAFYIGLGHRKETYAEPIMQRLMVEGLIYAIKGS